MGVSQRHISHYTLSFIVYISCRQHLAKYFMFLDAVVHLPFIHVFFLIIDCLLYLNY